MKSDKAHWFVAMAASCSPDQQFGRWSCWCSAFMRLNDAFLKITAPSLDERLWNASLLIPFQPLLPSRAINGFVYLFKDSTSCKHTRCCLSGCVKLSAQLLPSWYELIWASGFKDPVAGWTSAPTSAEQTEAAWWMRLWIWDFFG